MRDLILYLIKQAFTNKNFFIYFLLCLFVFGFGIGASYFMVGQLTEVAPQEIVQPVINFNDIFGETQ